MYGKKNINNQIPAITSLKIREGGGEGAGRAAMPVIDRSIEPKIMVWDYQVNARGEYSWTKVCTNHHVGSMDEHLYWRVVAGCHKDFFWKPEHYVIFSDTNVSDIEEPVRQWYSKQRALRSRAEASPPQDPFTAPCP